MKAQLIEISDYFSEVLTITPENPIAGNNVCITCTVIRKNMSATWSKDGVELSSNDKFKSTAKKRIHTLTVTTAEPNDSGTYCIEVENVKRQKEVKVEGKMALCIWIYWKGQISTHFTLNWFEVRNGWIEMKQNIIALKNSGNVYLPSFVFPKISIVFVSQIEYGNQTWRYN